MNSASNYIHVKLCDVIAYSCPEPLKGMDEILHPIETYWSLVISCSVFFEILTIYSEYEIGNVTCEIKHDLCPTFIITLPHAILGCMCEPTLWDVQSPHPLASMCVIKNVSLQWRHNGSDSVSNHQPHDCLLNRLFRRKSKKTSKFRVTGLCAGNSPGTGEFPAQMASYAETFPFDDVIMYTIFSKTCGNIILYATIPRCTNLVYFNVRYWSLGGAVTSV